MPLRSVYGRSSGDRGRARHPLADAFDRGHPFQFNPFRSKLDQNDNLGKSGSHVFI